MIEIQVSGPNATALADAAEAFLRELSGEKPERQALSADRGTARADPVAVAGLILMVPPAIVATLDLAERLRLAERLDRLRAALKARAGSDDRVELRAGDGPPLDVLSTDRDRLMDALSEATGKSG